jgi:hypothetical protein
MNRWASAASTGCPACGRRASCASIASGNRMSSGGQVVGGVVGAVAGFFLGGGTPSGALYGAQIGMTLGGYLDPPKGPTVEWPAAQRPVGPDQHLRCGHPARLRHGDGQRQRLLAGEQPAEGNGHQEEVGRQGRWQARRRRAPTPTRRRLPSGCARGRLSGVRRIWIGPDLIYDAGATDPDTLAASNAAASGFQLYLGTHTQAPDARMQATLGVANTPAWRGAGVPGVLRPGAGALRQQSGRGAGAR